MSDENGSAGGGQPGGAGAAGGGEPAPWYVADGMPPEQTAKLGELVKTKGWKHPSEALLSYANLESVFGADKAGRTILAPKADDDAEGWNAVYTRLGRPDTPDAYGLKAPEGDDGSFLTTAATWMHEAGLNTRQAAAMAEKWNAYVAEAQQGQQEAKERAFEESLGSLRKEWGKAADERTELARRAFGQFAQESGLDEAAWDKLGEVVGPAPLLKLFAAIGGKFAEGSFVGGDGRGAGYKRSPAEAQAEITKKFTDSEFMARYTNADASIRKVAIDEMMELQRAAHPELEG